MLYYDELKETIDRGFIKGDTVQIVRKNGKIHDYVLDGEQVEPHKTLSLEKARHTGCVCFSKTTEEPVWRTKGSSNG